MCTRPPVGSRVVAGVREGVVDTKIDAAPDDVPLRQVDQRRAECRCAVLDPTLRPAQDDLLKGGDEVEAAVGVAAVVDRIHPDPDLTGITRFGEAEGEREKDRVAGGDVRDGDAFRIDGVLWHLYVGGQGKVPKPSICV